MPPKGSCVRGSGSGMTAGHGRIPRRQGLPSGKCLAHRRHALADRESAVLSSSLCCWFAGTAGLPLSLQCETPFLQMPKTMESPDLKKKLPEPLLYFYLPCCDKILWPKELGKERFTAASNSKSQSVPEGSQGRCVKTILACYSTKHCFQPRKSFHRQRSTAGTMADVDW